MTDRLIVVGGGLSGIAVALGAALKGVPVTIFESDDKLGGAAAYSGGLVWIGANHAAIDSGIDDDLDRVRAYIRDIASRHPELLDEEAMERWITTAPVAARYWEDVGAITWTVIPGLADYHEQAKGALPEGRYITAAPVDRQRLGPWADKLRIGPYHPMGTTYAEALAKGRRNFDDPARDGSAGDRSENIIDDRAMVASRDEKEIFANDRSRHLTFGTGVVAAFLSRLLEVDGDVEILTGHRVTELLTRDGAVVGAVAQHAGQSVSRQGRVVLSTSGYDWNPELMREFIGVEEGDFGSVAPDSIRGDGLLLARSVGAATMTWPAGTVPMMPGWPSKVGTGFSHGPEACLPHSMIVDSSGRRFCDDSYWVDIMDKAFAENDRHWPMFLIWDDDHRQKYGLQETPPGGEYPEGLVTSAPTLTELGTALGIDGDALTETAAEFSRWAERGEDPHFGRGSVAYIARNLGDPNNDGNPLLGPIRKPPFHGLRLKVLGTGIGMSGIGVDAEARVLRPDGSVIEGLYAIGSCAAFTTSGTGYNSGFALSRGITHAYLIAESL